LGWKSQQKIEVVDNDSIHSEFFLRLLVTDVKGVLAKVTGIFNDHNVSIEALIQKQVDENNNAHIAITTDKVSTKAVMSIKEKIEASEFNQADVQIIHIELLN
jgi:homoserine dehydrogenase